ncbi:MAG: Gfo/Idh/MocA family protein, partial [Christensenellaceae bacterium]
MNPVKVIIVGNGERASCYCKYALYSPENLQVTAIVDPDKNKLKEGAKLYGVPERHCFESVEKFLEKREEYAIEADGVINATMDEYHYRTAIPLLKAGYHMLLEKPVVNNMEQLLDIERTAEENGCLLMVCHVLRYTPFYRGIKEVIERGEIGEIVHIETSENVGIAHASNSYIRGKWNSKEKCGSSMLLAKCCHDLDLLCWLNNKASPVKVASFGGRNFILPEKAPDGAGTRCLVDCPHVNDCRYSAKSIYVD